MSDIVNNTIVFSGAKEDIGRLDKAIGAELKFGSFINTHPEIKNWRPDDRIQWMLNNWGSTFCETKEKVFQDHGTFATLKVVFQSSYNPPLKVVDTLFSKFPNVKGIYKVSLESNLGESTYIRRNPHLGFQKFLVDSISGPDQNDECSNFQVLQDYADELVVNDELRITSGIVGVSLEWIESRKN